MWPNAKYDETTKKQFLWSFLNFQTCVYQRFILMNEECPWFFMLDKKNKRKYFDSLDINLVKLKGKYLWNLKNKLEIIFKKSSICQTTKLRFAKFILFAILNLLTEKIIKPPFKNRLN